MCKRGDTFSLAILIGRGLDQCLFLSFIFPLFHYYRFPPLFSFQGVFEQYAPLAQLVEHLTLNQGVQGSSP